MCVAIDLPTEYSLAPPRAGFFIAAGNAFSSSPSPQPMTLDTQMTLALLQELLMALRANDAEGRAQRSPSSIRWDALKALDRGHASSDTYCQERD